MAVFLLAAGCIQAQGSDPKTVQPSTAPQAAFSEDTGAVSGTVVSQETEPIAGAQLQLQPLQTLASTAADGAFSFSNVPAGQYTILAVALGFSSGVAKVDVKTGEVSKVTIVLNAIAVSQPRAEVFGPFNGYMQCRMSTPLSSGACGFLPVVGNTSVTSIWTNDKVIWNFGKFSSPDFSAITFESRWTPSSAATNPNMMQTFSYDGRPGTHWWADSGGHSSPIKFTWVRGETGPGGQIPSGTPAEHKEPTMNHTLRTWITIPFASVPPAELAYELRFQMMVTIWYSQTPADTYSAFGDA